MDNTLFFCLSLTVLILVDKTLFRHYSPNVNKCEGPLCHSKENVQYCNNQVVRVREINDWVKSDDKQPLISTIPNLAHVWWSCHLKHLPHSFYIGYQCQNMSYNHPPYWRQKHYCCLFHCFSGWIKLNKFNCEGHLKTLTSGQSSMS